MRSTILTKMGKITLNLPLLPHRHHNETLRLISDMDFTMQHPILVSRVVVGNFSNQLVQPLKSLLKISNFVPLPFN